MPLKRFSSEYFKALMLSPSQLVIIPIIALLDNMPVKAHENLLSKHIVAESMPIVSENIYVVMAPYAVAVMAIAMIGGCYIARLILKAKERENLHCTRDI